MKSLISQFKNSMERLNNKIKNKALAELEEKQMNQNVSRMRKKKQDTTNIKYEIYGTPIKD